MNECQSKTNKRIGQRLKLARINLNMSLLDLCDATGSECSCEQLESYELGRENIAASELSRLAESLQMPVDFFLDESPLLDCSGKWQLLRAFQVLDSKSQQRVMKLVLEM